MNWRWKDIKMLFETVPTWFIITAFLAIIIGESNADPSTECPAVDLPENGRLQYGKFEGSDIYIVICNAGFIVNGSSVVKCVEGEWEKPPPKCEEIKESQYCEEPPIPTHGSRICGEAIYPVGKKCKFKCKKTHFLRGPKIRTCQENLLWSGRKPICVLKPVCPSLRPLINGTVINCSPTDPPRSGDTCSFRCNPGFVLEGPQSLFCKPNGRLEDELFRETYPICVAGKPISSIADVGSNRNLNSLLNLCRSKGCSHKCNIINGIAKCLCPSGYQLFEDGKTCQGLPKHKPENPPTRKPQDNSDETNSTESSVQTSSIDTCQINNGNCSHFCSFVFGSAKCSCPAGYRLQEDRKTCEDIDECAEGKHKCSHQCHNNLGKYTCSCPPGYLLIDDLKCEGCRINSYKSEIEDVCLECPVNSYTKSEGKTSIADCLCYSGFTGDPAHNIPCEDIDECESENFGCSHTCMNMPGSAQCLCPLGYELQQDNKTCIDKDECSIKNGGCEGACHNSPGSFSCSCGTGYTSSQKDRFSCDDVDECEVDNGGCEQRCINYAGSFYCSCEDGYRLAADQKTCIAASCPREPVPNHLRMQCFTKNGTRLSSSSDSENRPHSELNDYPIGTKCQFKCDNGFKLTAEGKITCRDDGTWSGPVPECKGLHCPALEAPEHGEVRPPACTLGNVSVKKKCYFTCQPGYKLQGPPVMLCKNNRSWNKPEPPVCRSVSVNPSLSCPEDISVDLSPGQNYTTVVIPRPQTNTEDFSITPKWVLTETPLSFPSGRTDITFTVVSSNPKKQDKTCTMTVNVVDREPPIFLNCPESFDVEATSMQGTSVKWEEPRAVDNVGVESVSKNLEPDATLMPGVHIVTYRARDAAGNAAVCSFEINITSTQCNDLEDPANGEANCVDWMYGKLCQPFCDAGYTRNPDEYPYYTCDESGVWAPVDVISDCLKYLPASSKNCPEGYEYRKINETNEEICLECPTETIWSPSSRTCEEASFEEEDDNDEEEET